LPIYQRMPGTRLEIGTDAAADGGPATVAPNTGALQAYQPLDFRLSHDSSHDASIDVNGNPLQGNISGDDRLLNQPAAASAGRNAFSALVYSSDTVSVRPIAEIWASFPASMGVPSDIPLHLTFS